MNRSELVALVSEAFPELRQAQIHKAVSRFFEEIMRSVDEGRRVELRGFGVFFVSFRKPKLGRNPKTGDAVAIPAKRKLAFRAGINLKGKINANPKAQSLQGAGKNSDYRAGKARQTPGKA
jgi:integration host factor subunit beta